MREVWQRVRAVFTLGILLIFTSLLSNSGIFTEREAFEAFVFATFCLCLAEIFLMQDDVARLLESKAQDSKEDEQP